MAETGGHRAVEQTDGGYLCAVDGWTGTTYNAFRLHVAEDEIIELRATVERLRAAGMETLTALAREKGLVMRAQGETATLREQLAGPAAPGAQAEDDTDEEEEGYPTEEELEHLATFHGSPRQFVGAIRDIWWPNDDYIRETPVTLDGTDRIDVEVSTVGWSGNEEIMGTVKDTFFHLLWWRTIQRGGHYTYSVPADQYDTTWDLGVLGHARGPAVVGPVPHISTP